MQNEEFNDLDYNAPLANELAKLPAEPEPSMPNNPPWNSLFAFLFWILSVLAIFIFPAFFIVPYVIISRQGSLENFQNDSTAIFLNLIAIIPAHFFTLAVAWFIVTKNGKFSVSETLGFKTGGFRWWYYPLLLIGLFALAAGVNYVIPEGENDMMKILQSSRMAVYTIAILATFTAPLVEEIVYRGVLYSAFQRSVGVTGAVFIVTIMFAAVHVPQYWGSPATILMICLLSLVLTLIRVKSDNLLPCIIMHTFINGIQALLLVAEPYLPKPETNIQEPAAFIFKLFT